MNDSTTPPTGSAPFYPSSATVHFTIPASAAIGHQYEFRFFLNNSWTVEAVSAPVTVAAAGSPVPTPTRTPTPVHSSSGATNFQPTVNFTGTDAQAMIAVLGSNAAPDLTQDAVSILQKWSGNSTPSGVNQTAYFSNIKTSTAPGTRVQSIFAESEDAVGWNGTYPNNFIEGIRSHAVLIPPASTGSAYGFVADAAEEYGASHLYLIGTESEVDNRTVDPPRHSIRTASWRPLWRPPGDRIGRMRRTWSIHGLALDMSAGPSAPDATSRQEPVRYPRR
jgi:hypothetical protein